MRADRARARAWCGRAAGAARVQVEQGHPVDAAICGEVLAPSQVAAVEDHDHVRAAGRWRGRAEPGRLASSVVEQLLQLGAELVTSRTGPSASHCGRVLGVRQPLGPLPLGAPVRAGADRDQQVVWGVEDRELGEHRPGQARAGCRVVRPAPAQEHPGEAAHRQRHRQVGHHRVGVEEAAQRAGGHRLQLVQRAGDRRDQRGGQRLRPDGDPDHAEVGVGRTALPQPVAVHRGPQLAPGPGWR